jgi:hypothetical protein
MAALPPREVSMSSHHSNPPASQPASQPSRYDPDNMLAVVKTDSLHTETRG